MILDGALKEQARLEFPLSGLSNYALPSGIIASTMATYTRVYRILVNG